MRLQTPTDRFLARQLARSVDAGRTGFVALGIGVIGLTGEHIVGGNMEQRNASVLGRLGEVARAVAVHRIGLLTMRFGIVHMGIGGRIDDQPGTLTHHCRNLLGLRDVQLGPCRRQHLQPETCCPFHQFSTHLAAGTANEDSHSL